MQKNNTINFSISKIKTESDTKNSFNNCFKKYEPEEDYGIYLNNRNFSNLNNDNILTIDYNNCKSFIFNDNNNSKKENNLKFTEENNKINLKKSNKSYNKLIENERKNNFNFKNYFAPSHLKNNSLKKQSSQPLNKNIKNINKNNLTLNFKNFYQESNNCISNNLNTKSNKKNYEEKKLNENSEENLLNNFTKNNYNNNTKENNKINIIKCENPAEYKILYYDDLTPLPKRIGPKKNPIAEHDYNQAKSAAILVRRLEYSYNLRILKKYNIFIPEIVYIQKWWKNYLQKKNTNLLNILIQEEYKNFQFENYIKNFIQIVTFYYNLKRIEQYFKNIKKFNYKEEKLKKMNKNILIIQKNYRKFIKLKNKKLKRKFYIKLKIFAKIYKNVKILILFKELNNNINKIFILQKFIKNRILIKNENYLLSISNSYHPKLYYLLKYRNNNFLKRKKIKNFLNFIEKWKNLRLKNKRINYINLSIKILLFYKKIYFNIFIMKLIRKANLFLIYFLLKPLMKEIQKIYFTKKVGKKFKTWKTKTNYYKHINLLQINFIKILIKNFVFKSFIKNLKIKIIKNNFISKIIKNIKKNIKNFIFIYLKNILYYKKIMNNKIKNLYLKSFLFNKYHKNLFNYFNKWKNINFLQNKLNENENLTKKIFLNKLINNKSIKNSQNIFRYFFLWRILTYKLTINKIKYYYFLNDLSKILNKNIKKFIFNFLKINRNFQRKNEIIKIILKRKNKKNNLILKKYFTKWTNIIIKNKINKNGNLINFYYKKKLISYQNNNKKKKLLNLFNKKENKNNLILHSLFLNFKKNIKFKQIVFSAKIIQKFFRNIQKNKKLNYK